MVDISTAMAAAAADGRRRPKGAKDDDRKKRRAGGDLGLEPFDPVLHVQKEKAAAASMWLVLGFAVATALTMRYLMMPTMSPDDKLNILYVIPLLLIFAIPTLHRLVMPEKFKEHYTRGTWFKAAFLHTFTWLALSFLLINPPMGDIVAPKVVDGWNITYGEGEDLMLADRNDTISEGNVTLSAEGADPSTTFANAILWFALEDNADPADSEVVVKLSDVNTAEEFILKENIANTVTDHENLTSLTRVVDGVDDVVYAFAIGTHLTHTGEYVLNVEITEDGDPWTNVRSYEWTIEIVA